jgi:hypothetical protein
MAIMNLPGVAHEGHRLSLTACSIPECLWGSNGPEPSPDELGQWQTSKTSPWLHPQRATARRRTRTSICRHRSCVRGAGGNRTPVRQVVTEPDTTIPASRPRRLPNWRVSGLHEEVTAGSFPDVSGLSRRQWSFPTVHPRFCCRAAWIRPRAPLLVTILLFYLLIRSGGESELLIFGGSFGAPV